MNVKQRKAASACARYCPVFERSSMKARYPVFTAAAAALFALAACQADRSGDCPTITGVTDASVATVFRPGTTSDPANVLYTVEITSVQGTCDMDKKETTSDATVDINFRATRAPSGAEAHYRVPYFVAVTEGSARVMARRAYSIAIDFAPGQTTAEVNDTVGSAHIDVAKGKHPYDYQVLVGLQLTKDQLEYNRQGSHYGS
jgi:hypothetical protein